MMKTRVGAFLLGFLIVGSITLSFYFLFPLKHKKEYDTTGGIPELLNNPFEDRPSWLKIYRSDKNENLDLTPDTFVMEVTYEPFVTKFANGSYRITLKVDKK